MTPSSPMGGQPVHLWSLSEDVAVRASADTVVLTGRFGSEKLDDPSPVVREVLRRMELGPILPANVAADYADGDGVCLLLLPTLSRLSHMTVRTLSVDDLKGPLLSVSPESRQATFDPEELSGDDLLRLPRDVRLTLGDAGISLASPASLHRVVLHRPEAVWVVAMLAWPVTPGAATEALPLHPDVTDGILRYLAAAGMAQPVAGHPRRFGAR
ncbi:MULTISPECIES: NADH oxidase [Streptomyces]|uniref:NADH oxidase n=1 Tax=Streptomyces xanthii TaxID=2768069 RepID=A0A7H1BBD7_9ACTN|nr:NADH oxidase [Streptomyces xanthii]QNS06042.1 NADH oxidase [Streptomyces xanthii]